MLKDAHQCYFQGKQQEPYSNINPPITYSSFRIMGPSRANEMLVSAFGMQRSLSRYWWRACIYDSYWDALLLPKKWKTVDLLAGSYPRRTSASRFLPLPKMQVPSPLKLWEWQRTLFVKMSGNSSNKWTTWKWKDSPKEWQALIRLRVSWNLLVSQRFNIDIDFLLILFFLHTQTESSKKRKKAKL